MSITRALALEDDVVKGMGLDRDFEGDRALLGVCYGMSCSKCCVELDNGVEEDYSCM